MWGRFKMKTITIKDETWNELWQLKLKWKCPTLDDVIVRLIDDEEDET